MGKVVVMDLFGQHEEVEDKAQTVKRELDQFMSEVRQIVDTNGIEWLFRLVRSMRHSELLSERKCLEKILLETEDAS